MGTGRQLAGTTIRSRVACALAIADYALRLAKGDSQLDLAMEAIDSAWEWERCAMVPPDQLYGYVECEEEEGGGLVLNAACAETGSTAESVLGVVASAVAYVTWHAYLQAGKARMPETIAEVTESTLDDVLTLATRIPGYEASFANRVAAYCVASFSTNNQNELGCPVERELLMQVGVGRKPDGSAPDGK